jgi:hypothetical protein
MTEIILNGVDENKRTEARNEIESILRDFFGEEHPVSSIIVTENFREEIQQIINRTSGSKIAYDSQHEYGIAYAKTTHYIKDEKLAFTIILDGVILGRWLEEEYLTRLATLLHELIHVRDENLRWKSVGTDEFFKEPKGKQDGLFHNALIVWEEYRANKLVTEIFENLVKEKGWKVNYSYALNHAETFHNLLGNIHEYVVQNIQDFRNWKLTPTEICYRITSRVCGILVLCAYTYAVIDFSNEIKEKIARIEECEGYHFLLADNWPTIHSILKELYLNANKYIPAHIHKIANEINAVYLRCGLEISDAGENLWLDVHDIG